MRRAGTLAVATVLLVVALAGAALAAAIDGDRRDNRLVGTERADTVRGLGGDDAVYGRGGADRLVGGLGNDTVYGGDGDDNLLMRDGVAGNDTARCGTGQDTARVDSMGEASFYSSPFVPGDRAEDALCETVVFRAEATGVLEKKETVDEIVVPEQPECGTTHQIRDEAPSAGSPPGYALRSDTVDLAAYEGRRVTVSGWVTYRAEGCGRVMDVTSLEEL